MEGKDFLIIVAIDLLPEQCLAHSSRMINLVLGPLYATAIVISKLILQVRKWEHDEVNSQTHYGGIGDQFSLPTQFPCS